MTSRARRSRPVLIRALIMAVVVAALFAAPGAAGMKRHEGVEKYALKLINCTRTGGWVKRDGHCDGYGSGRYSKYVAPLKASAGIANVARKWARHLAEENACGHGDPGARLRRAGYHPSWWGENVGCNNYATVYDAVLQSHRAMQAEKSSGGGHWKNIKNSAYRYAGVGIWRYHGRTRVVTDFYRP